MFSVGMNCALGPRTMRPHLEELSRVASVPISCHPECGPAKRDGPIRLRTGRDGGARRRICSTRLGQRGRRVLRHDPRAHIEAIADVVRRYAPRPAHQVEPLTRLSGTHPFTMYRDNRFVMIGERTNVTGSRKFARLIKERQYDEALEVARQQVEGARTLSTSIWTRGCWIARPK